MIIQYNFAKCEYYIDEEVYLYIDVRSLDNCRYSKIISKLHKTFVLTINYEKDNCEDLRYLSGKYNLLYELKY